MQVRSCAKASGTDVADYLTLGDGAAASNIFCEARQMRIERYVFLPVLKGDHLSVLMLPTNKSYFAIGRRHNRVASTSSVIYPFVGTPFF